MELQHGDKVRCVIDNQLIEDAKISIDQKGYIWICQNDLLSGPSIANMLGYKYATLFGIKGSTAQSKHVSDLTIINEPIASQETVEQTKVEDGSIIKNPSQELADLISSKFPPDKISMALNLIKTLT